jgi:hypothetical protein
MNEQIDALLVKAGAYFGGDSIDYSMFDANKFAELIVRECVDTVLDCTVEYSTRPQIAQELKQHFGVE